MSFLLKMSGDSRDKDIPVPLEPRRRSKTTVNTTSRKSIRMLILRGCFNTSSDSPSPRPSVSTSRRSEPKSSTSKSTLGKSAQTKKKGGHNSGRKEEVVIAAFGRRLKKDKAKAAKPKL